MHLNGQPVSGRFEEDEFRCFVSPTVASRSEGLPLLDRAVVQANYQGTCFTADVPIVVRDIDCDVVIGREWIPVRTGHAQSGSCVLTCARAHPSACEPKYDSYIRFRV